MPEDHILLFIRFYKLVDNISKELEMKDSEARTMLLAYYAAVFKLIPFTQKRVQAFLGYNAKTYDVGQKTVPVFAALVEKGYFEEEPLRHTTAYHLTPTGIAVVGQIINLATVVVAEAHRPARAHTG